MLMHSPEIAELARVMWEAREQVFPEELQPGEWHVPFVNTSQMQQESVIIGILFLIQKK